MALGSELESISADTESVFDLTYSMEREDLLRLYEKAKRNQWNVSTALDWDRPVDPERGILEDERIAIYGTRFWDRLDSRRQALLNYYHSAWNLSQFLQGEQGALLAACEITEGIPWLEGKLCAASQVVDEGRHVEVYARYLKSKLGKVYPASPALHDLLTAILRDSRWYWKLVGMQLIVESLALAGFKGMVRNAKEELIKDALKYVMADESRHVGFGVMGLKRLIPELPEREREDLAEFAFEACGMMARGFFPQVVYEEVGFTSADLEHIKEEIRYSAPRRDFLRELWAVLVPNLKRVGLITPRIRPRYAAVGLMEYEDLPLADSIPLPGGER